MAVKQTFLFPITNPLLDQLRKDTEAATSVPRPEATPVQPPPEFSFEQFKAEQGFGFQTPAEKAFRAGEPPIPVPDTGREGPFETFGRVLGKAARAVGNIPLAPGLASQEEVLEARLEEFQQAGFDIDDPSVRAKAEREVALGEPTIGGVALAGAAVGTAVTALPIEVLDAGTETAFSLAKLQKPKGYTEALANFRDRSIIVQMALGLVFDPAIVFGVLGVSARASRGVIAVAVRANLTKTLPNVSKRVLDAAVEVTTDRLTRAVGNEVIVGHNANENLIEHGAAAPVGVIGFQDEMAGSYPFL